MYAREQECGEVFLVRSIHHPEQSCVATCYLGRHLGEHNAVRSPHTSAHTPWELVAALRFADERRANAFERYLKMGSERALAKRRYWKRQSRPRGRACPSWSDGYFFLAASLYMPRPTRLNRLSLARVFATVFLKCLSFVT